MQALTPQEIVHELDKHIIGQDAAKRAVAIALRNRWRRTRFAAYWPVLQAVPPMLSRYLNALKASWKNIRAI